MINLKIEIGHPEISLICGTIVACVSHLWLGVTLCALGVFGAVCRSGLKIQKEQQEEADRKELIKEIQNAGGDIADSLISLINKATPKKTVH